MHYRPIEPLRSCLRSILMQHFRMSSLLKHFLLLFFNTSPFLSFLGVCCFQRLSISLTSLCGCSYLLHVEISPPFSNTGVWRSNESSAVCFPMHLWKFTMQRQQSVGLCACARICEKLPLYIYVTNSRLSQNTAMATATVNTSIQTRRKHDYKTRGPLDHLWDELNVRRGFLVPVTLTEPTADTVGHEGGWKTWVRWHTSRY